MEQRSYICLNCQVPLKLEWAQRRPESADSEKKNEKPLMELLTGHSKNLLKLIMDSKFPSEAPVCVGCSDALINEMDTVLASKEDEISTYKTYMETMAQNHPSSEIPELKARLQNLTDEEKQLEQQLKKLLAEEALLDQELQTKRRAAEKSLELTAKLWGEYRDNLRIVYNDQNILKALDAERSYADVQLRKLIETSVLDLCFHIWVESNVGEINGFRLGYLKESPVEFSEINSAFGQVVLLIEVLFELIGVQHHELVTAPLGSHSYIKLRQKDDTFPMFGQGTPLSGSATLLDSGIRKFLQMLDFLQKEVKDRNKSFKPPFQIVAESLVDNGVKYSAVMTLNTEVRWTRAMAMMLTNLKAVCGQINALRNPL